MPSPIPGGRIHPVRLVRLPASRVVADPAAIDRATGVPAPGDEPILLRTAPDEAIAIGVSEPPSVADPDAIALPDAGLAGAWLDATALEAVRAHVEWELPRDGPALAQGKVAGVPAKLWLAPPEDPRGAALLVVQAAYAADLAERLGFADEVDR